jgi:hypothetical protein
VLIEPPVVATCTSVTLKRTNSSGFAREASIVAQAGQTINVPANAPHAFTNAGQAPARLLCLCAPAGQEEFFTLVGQPVATRTEPPPPLDAEAQAAFAAKSRVLAPRYKTELLPPPSRD